jgi:hypothetical protein
MKKLKKKQFEELYAPLEEELVAMARWAAKTGARIVVLFEGRDTAGKGGAIKAIAGPLNPRQCRVVALSKPSEAEQGQWYFQRYVAHLPAAGRNRAVRPQLVQPRRGGAGNGLLQPDQVAAFLEGRPRSSRLLVEDGDAAVQILADLRSGARKNGWPSGWPTRSSAGSSRRSIWPRVRSTTPTRPRARRCWPPPHAHAPWTLVDFNDQRLGRLTLIRDLLDRLPDTHVEPVGAGAAAAGSRTMAESYGRAQADRALPGQGKARKS